MRCFDWFIEDTNLWSMAANEAVFSKCLQYCIMYITVNVSGFFSCDTGGLLFFWSSSPRLQRVLLGPSWLHQSWRPISWWYLDDISRVRIVPMFHSVYLPMLYCRSRLLWWCSEKVCRRHVNWSNCKKNADTPILFCENYTYHENAKNLAICIPFELMNHIVTIVSNNRQHNLGKDDPLFKQSRDRTV